MGENRVWTVLAAITVCVAVVSTGHVVAWLIGLAVVAGLVLAAKAVAEHFGQTL